MVQTAKTLREIHLMNSGGGGKMGTRIRHEWAHPCYSYWPLLETMQQILSLKQPVFSLEHLKPKDNIDLTELKRDIFTARRSNASLEIMLRFWMGATQVTLATGSRMEVVIALWTKLDPTYGSWW
jgi:hypothetical protein